MFTDLSAARSRWGLSDVTSGSTPDRIKAYLNRSANSPVGGGLLNAAPMAAEYGWGELDVQWAIGDFGSIDTRVVKLRDDLDLGVVERSLVAHRYVRTGPDTRPLFALDPGIVQMGPGFTDAVLLVDRHVLVTGRDAAAVAAVADGAQSIAATDHLQDLLVAGAAPEYLSVRIGDDACIGPMRAAGPQSELDRMKVLIATFRALHPLVGVAASAIDDTRATVIGRYADAAAATADLPLRQSLLADAPAETEFSPFAHLATLDSLTVADRTLHYAVTFRDSVQDLDRMIRDDSAPWSFCP